MRTTLKRGIGRATAGNGNGHAVLPPGALSPVTRYQQPEKRRGALRTVGLILFILVALGAAVVAGVAGGAYIYTDEGAHALAPRQRPDARRRRRSSRCPAGGRAGQRARHRLRPSPGGRQRAVALGHGHAAAGRPGHEHDLDALVPARPDRQRPLPRRPHVQGADQRGLLVLRACRDARDRPLAHRPADPLPDHGQLPGLPRYRQQARRCLDGRRPPLLQPARRRLRDDQPLARLPEARRLAGARLRPLPAHRLRPLPPRAPAALRQRRQAGGQRPLEEPEDRRRSSSR